MLVLFETPAGFALFKVLDEGKLSKVEDLWKEFSSSDLARQVVKLKAFSKFENTTEALEAAVKITDGKPTKGLRKFLRSHCSDETLAVADSKLGNAIKEALKIECVHNNAVMELMRGLRSQLTELITGLPAQDLAPMSLGLSHSLSRYKLKFSPEKVDTMIIQAIGLLDDLDKELNTYAMRVKEWYGWHFPELAKIVQDNILYAKVIKLMGSRENAPNIDFSEMLGEEMEQELKDAVMISMGTEVSDSDLANIKQLCDQVLSLSEYRAQLYDYLKSRMNTIAPNLTALVGELLGSRLIARAGSLLNLAKQPGSTVQILGSEKALFKALKMNHATPKYGLIYQASLVGQAPAKIKGKISRSLAAKSILAIRYDALGDTEDNSMGLQNRIKLEARLRSLEGRELSRAAGSAKGKPKIEVYDKDRKKGFGGMITPAKVYNPSSDSLIGKTATGHGDKDVPSVQNEREEPGSITSVGPTGEEGKKRKRKGERKLEKTEISEHEEEAEEAKQKKKKKKEQTKKETDEVPDEQKVAKTVTVKAEEEEEGGGSKKKKKKDKKMEMEGMPGEETKMAEGSQAEAEDEGDRKKRKKKKEKNKMDSEGVRVEVDDGGDEKKKKKRKHTEEESSMKSSKKKDKQKVKE